MQPLPPPPLQVGEAEGCAAPEEFQRGGQGSSRTSTRASAARVGRRETGWLQRGATSSDSITEAVQSKQTRQNQVKTGPIEAWSLKLSQGRLRHPNERTHLYPAGQQGCPAWQLGEVGRGSWLESNHKIHTQIS